MLPHLEEEGVVEVVGLLGVRNAADAAVVVEIAVAAVVGKLVVAEVGTAAEVGD